MKHTEHQNLPVNKWPSELNRQFSKEEIELANNYFKVFIILSHC